MRIVKKMNNLVISKNAIVGYSVWTEDGCFLYDAITLEEAVVFCKEASTQLYLEGVS